MCYGHSAEEKLLLAVQIKISAKRTDATTGAVTEVVLSDELVTINYKVKKGKVKGKNF